jgi:hypothetical protein
VTKQRELPSKGEDIAFKLEVVEMGTTKFGSPATTCVALPDDSPRETKKPKSESKVDGNVKIFTDAWFSTGCETQGDNMPYVSRGGLKRYLMEMKGYKGSTADQMMRPSAHGQFINSLDVANIIKSEEHGWVVINEVVASTMLIRKNG